MRWVRPALTTSANSVSLRRQGSARCSRAGTRSSDGRRRRRDAQGAGERVVARLAGVDVVVGVDVEVAREVREPCHDLVDVHVGRRAGAGLEDVDRELVVVVAVRDLTRPPRDRSGAAGVEHAELGVDVGGGGLEQRECVDDAGRHRLPADREVLDGPRRLRAPQGVGGHLHLAHRVVLGPEALRCDVAHAPIIHVSPTSSGAVAASLSDAGSRAHAGRCGRRRDPLPYHLRRGHGSPSSSHCVHRVRRDRPRRSRGRGGLAGDRRHRQRRQSAHALLAEQAERARRRDRRADPGVVVAGSNDEIDEESCAAGDPTTCPFTPASGCPACTSRSRRGRLDPADVHRPHGSRLPRPAACTAHPGPIGTLPGTPERASCPTVTRRSRSARVRARTGVLVGQRLASLLRQPHLERLGGQGVATFKGFEAIAVSRTDDVPRQPRATPRRGRTR